LYVGTTAIFGVKEFNTPRMQATGSFEKIGIFLQCYTENSSNLEMEESDSSEAL
jgi:hypothetical protein